MAALGRALLQSDVSKFLQATRPLLVNGKWRKPQINARIVAKLRKEAFLSEQEFPIPLSPLKDAVTRRKGNKHERGAEARYSHLRSALDHPESRLFVPFPSWLAYHMQFAVCSALFCLSCDHAFPPSLGILVDNN
eukprot:m.195379 g.195379  ORF g.195379 m.195379 type:complete len:135 (-) comp53717_c0_seq16:1203-1607(-)